MPEPAALAKDEKELTFATEEDKVAKLEEIQARTPTVDDLPEIERIQNAPVLEAHKETSPAEDLVEPETSPQPTEALPDKPTQEEKPTDEARNWTIDEELISKYNETYTDETGRTRPIFTQKDPEALLKSFADSQKYIQHLKSKTQNEYNAGYEKAKAEYEAKLAEVQKTPVVQKPAPVTPPVAPVNTGIIEEYNKLAEEVSQIPEGDEIEHMDKIKRLNVLTPKVFQEQKNFYSENINQLKTELTGEINTFKTDYEQQKSLAEQQKLAKEHQQKLDRVFNEVDQWAASKNAPEEAKIDQTFKEVLSEATAFHNELAELYTGKTAREVLPEDWNKYMEYAGTAYLNQLPELVQKVNTAGVQEPKNYRKWVFLDNIEAMKNGFMRDEKGSWGQRFDEVTGNPVNFGSMDAAYNYYLDKSGKRQEQISQEKKKNTADIIHAVNKRDSTVVQLDDSQLAEDGDGGVLTEEDAAKILTDLNDAGGVAFAQQQAMYGNVELLNKVNAALVRLGNQPIELPKQYTITK